MSTEPYLPRPTGPQAAIPSLADLLAVRPPTHEGGETILTTNGCVDDPLQDEQKHEQDVHSSAGKAVTPPLAPSPVAQDDDVEHSEMKVDMGVEAAAPAPLLLVHTDSPEGGLLKSWMQCLLDGRQPHTAQFHDPVVDMVHQVQPRAIMIHFDPGLIDTATALANQLQTLYPNIPRVAVGRTKHPHCVLAALRTGVQDFLDVDGSIEVAQQAVRALVSRPQPTSSDQPSAPLTAILSARAGLGCSLLATHLAWYLQQRLQGLQPLQGSAQEASDMSGLLIDLGSLGGDSAIYLNTPGEFSFLDAVNQQQRLDRRMAQSALARHDSGLRLLTLPHQMRNVASRDIDSLIARLRQYFKHIVLDLSATAATPLSLAVLPKASQIWVVCDQSVASVVWTSELLSQLEAKNIERNRLQLIVSRHDPRMELSAQHIARQLQLPLLAVIPERRRELAKVVNQGKLLAPEHKNEPYVRAMDQLVSTLLLAHHPEVMPPPATSGTPWSRMLRRLSSH